MQLLILAAIAVICFALLTFFRQWRDADILILAAIGCAIGSNIYNSVTMPVVIGGYTFGIDSVLYTVFMFAVIIRAEDYSVREARSMTLTTIAAIMISAFIEFFARWSFAGIDTAAIVSLASYAISSVGTFAGVRLMLWCFEGLRARKINVYVNFALCVHVASAINSLIYFGGTALLGNEAVSDFPSAFCGSYIGKTGAICIGLIGFFVNRKFLAPKNVSKKQAEKGR